MRVGTECGQRWYRLHSWYCRYSQHEYCSNKNKLRKFPGGFAVGPIMITRGDW